MLQIYIIMAIMSLGSANGIMLMIYSHIQEKKLMKTVCKASEVMDILNTKLAGGISSIFCFVGLIIATYILLGG